MSFEKIGQAIKKAKELNNLTSTQRNMSNDIFKDAVVKAAKNESGLSASQQINEMKKRGLNDGLINDIMVSAANQPDSSERKSDITNALKENNIASMFEDIQESANKAGDSVKEFDKKANLKDAEKSTTGFASKFKTSMKDSVEKTHTQFSNGVTKFKAKLGDVKSAIGSVGTGMIETLRANLPATLLTIGTGVAAIANGYMNTLRSRALNAGTKNLNKYNKKINKSQSKLESVNDIKAEFNRLAKGVDNTTNQNVGLSESDYSRYLELKKQLVKTNKDLVKSMDSEGNAIIDNNSAIDKSIKKYERQIQKNKQAIASKKNLAIQNKAAALNMNKATEGYQVGDRSLAGNVGRILSGGKSGVGLAGAGIGAAIGTLIAPGAGTAVGAGIGYSLQSAANLIGSSLLGTNDAGALHSIFASKKSIQGDGLNSNKSNLISMIKKNSAYKKEAKSILGKKADLDNLSDTQLSTLLNNANFESGGLGVKDNTMSKYVEATKDNLQKVQDQLKQFKESTLENTLEASQGFATLDKTSQEFAKNYVSNMDLSSDKMSGEGATKYLEEQEQKVRSFTSKLATDPSLKDAYEKFSDIKGDTSLTGKEWQKQINKQFETLKKKTGASTKELSGMLGVSMSGNDVLTADGQNVQKMIQTLKGEFKNQKTKDQKTVADLQNQKDFTKLISQYQSDRQERLSKGSSKVGNVDLNGRPVLLNNDKKKSYSTLISSSMAGADGSMFENKEIMYTPVLSSTGKKLDEKTMQKYISQITSKATSKDELLKLDSKGLEIGGQKVKNVIEGVADSVDEANKKTKSFHENNEKGYDKEAESLQKIKDYMVDQGGKYEKLGEKLNSSVDFDKIFGGDYFENLSLDQLSEAYDLITDKNEIFTGSLEQLKQRLDNVAKYKDSGLSYTLDSYTQATKSADDDANYNTFVSGLKSAKDEWDKGKVGTDQFKQMAGLISPTGKTDDKNFKENYDNIKKYFTSDDSGPKEFVSQLQSMTNASGEAMAKLNEKTGDYKVKIDNVGKAAKKMGMGVTPFESILNNLKTYGWDVQFDSLTEQWDGASEKLNEWSQAWQKNGGSLGDSQGKEIENYKQQLEDLRRNEEELPEGFEQTLTIKLNVAEAETTLTNSVDEYLQKIKDRGDNWVQSDDAKQARNKIFDEGSAATDKADKAQGATLSENGSVVNQKYEAEREKKDKTVQDALQKADETGSKKDMEAYLKAVRDRQNLITAGATDSQYYLNTKFKNENGLKKELKRNGATIGKDGSITASKDNQDVKTIIDAYNKEHKDNQIKVTWENGQPTNNQNNHSNNQNQQGNNQKPKKQEKPESSEKGNKSPSLLDKFNNWIKNRQTKETKGDYKKPAEGSGKKTGDTDKKYESVKSWFKSIPSNLNGLFKNAQTKQPSVSYQKPKVQGTQSWQTDNTKYNKAVSSAKKFGGDVVSGAKNIGSSALSGAKSILGSIGSGIKGLFGGSKSSASVSQNASKKQSSKSDVKVNAKGNAKKTIDSIKKSLSSMKSKSISIKVKGNAKKTISSISKSLKKLKSKSISIKVKGNASSVIKKIASALKKLKNKKITVKVKDSASSKISSIKGKLNALGKMHPTPKVTINTSGLHDVEAAKSAINGLHDKSVNVSVNYSQSGKPAKGGGVAHGTAAFAHGTIPRITNSRRALASGTLGAKFSGLSLTGEVAPELVVRGNKWFTTGDNGAEFTDIRRGDIVFNHQQTADLLSKGSTNSRASIKGGMSAFAHGTALSSGQSATASGGWRGGIAEKSGSSSTKKHTESTKKNTEATKKNTDSKKKDSKATDKSTKKKSKFAILLDNMGKQFDLIAIAIDRAATATEKFANMINDYVKPEVKQSALWNQYKSTGKEISVNQQAAKKYKSEASSFASKAIKTVPKTKNSSKKKNQKRLRTYFERVRNGSMNINTIKNDNMRSAVESYQNLYEKYLQANSAAQQLKNTQRDLFNQWLNMPTEKAQKAIENLQNSYDTLSNRSSAASTGESGVARLVQTSNDRLSEAQSNVSSAKSTQSRASSANKTAQKKVSKATKSQKSKAKSATKAVNKSGLSKKKKASLNKSIKAGKTISTKGLKGSAKKKVTAYNKAVKSTKSAKSSAAKTSANLSSANSALYDAQVYLDNVTKEQAIASNYAGQPAYTYQNDVLKNQVDNKKEQYENSQTAVREASKNQAKYQKESENAQANKNKADSAVKTKGSSILSGKKAKKLSNSQKNAIKSGKEVSLKGIKDKSLLKQLKAYNEQVKKAKDASNKLAQAKQKEADATNALATANKNANDAAADWAAEQTNAAVQSQANIKAYYDAKQNYESQRGTNAESAANNKQAHGQDLQVSDYQAQIDSKQRNKQLAIEKKAKLQDNLNQKLNDGSIKQGSQEWLQMQTEIDACDSEINDLDTGIENLKDTMRDDVFYRGFERALEASKHLQNSIETINSLISDEDMMFDMDGNITDYGVTAIATNIADYNKYKDDIKTYLGEIDQIESDWRNGNIKSEEEYKKKKREAEEGITTSMKGMQSAQKANVEILKSNAKLRIDAINKTIDAYKNCLQKTKDYYSYDKQLKSSNKEIQILESKRRALEGVNTAEAKAQKARLDAELQEKKDARDDTVKDHIYSLQIDGLEELSTKLNDDYEKYAHELSSSVENIKDLFDKLTNVVGNDTETVVNTVDKVLKTLYGVTADQIGLKKSDYTVTSDQQSEAQKSIQESMLKNMMSVMTPEAANSLATQLLSNLQEVSDTQMSEQQQEIAKKILEALNTNTASITGYAKGGLVKSVHKNGDDGLAALAVGEEVATVDVVNLANKIRQDKVLNALANGHTLNGMTMDGIGTTEINVNFGEAIGAINVPSGVSDEELQRIVNESYKYTSQKVTRDMAKIVGRKRPV